jgi:hypothetical protein
MVAKAGRFAPGQASLFVSRRGDRGGIAPRSILSFGLSAFANHPRYGSSPRAASSPSRSFTSARDPPTMRPAMRAGAWGWRPATGS